MIRRMKAGKVYMNSLTEKAFRTWISRSESLLSQHSGTNDVSFLRDTNIPDELRVLRIKRIDILEDGIRYVWGGGFDHTCLSVYRLPEGGYRITAQYDDSHGRQLGAHLTGCIDRRRYATMGSFFKVKKGKSLCP